jgi:hexosaminidase
MELQAHLMRRVQAMLRGMGKALAGWDEVAQGGGVEPEGTLLVGWQAPEATANLIRQGYRVVASPGQKYYLDMAQASGFDEPGASWAGVSTPEDSYCYRPDAGLEATEAQALAGIQAGIWCEHIHDPAIFNHMAFPRLSGVAETGWTPEAAKDWPRFAALSRLMPQL